MTENIIKIYGKKDAVSLIDNMVKSGRLAHSFLIYGESGVGKKTLAKYFVLKMMCENKEESPCFKCRTCKNIMNENHPDVIYAEHSGKLNGISIETARNISVDSFIKPNNGGKKIYLFTDADKITVPAQNSLLKLIEEPPDYSYYIFTAASKDVFLKTIISRTTTVGVSECTENQCRQALKDVGFDEYQINSAYEVFQGNIGKCIQYIKDDNTKSLVDLTKRIYECIIRNDEYNLLRELTTIEKDRVNAKQVLYMLDSFIRHKMVSAYGLKSSISLSGISVNSCIKIHNSIDKAVQNIDLNVNLKLVLAVLCGDIMKGQEF